MLKVTGVNCILVFRSNYPCKKNVISFVVAELKVKVTFLLTYCIYPKYSDRQVGANSVDPDQMPHSVASDQGLHCLSLIL